MTPQDVIDIICTRFSGVVPKSSYGETSLFYNPGKQLPNGVYFCTIKEKDGANDKASNLSRDGVFRLSIGLGTENYTQRFGPKPARPPKGGIVETGYDFTAHNVLSPHPIYAWMGWAQVLNPDRDTFDALLPLIADAHQAAQRKFEKKVGK
jgi:hypothetical protein